MFLAYQDERAPQIRLRAPFAPVRKGSAKQSEISKLRLQPRPLGGLSYENSMDQHKILPVPETFRISPDRSDGSHPVRGSRGGNSSKHGPVKRKPSAGPGTGRVVALHRDYSGIRSPH